METELLLFSRGCFFRHRLNSRGCAIPVTLIKSQDLAFRVGFLVNSYKHPADEGKKRERLRKQIKKKINKTQQKTV